MNQQTKTEKPLRVLPECAGQRLDTWLQHMLPEFSRGQLQRAIRGGSVRINNARAKPAQRLRGGEAVEVVIEPAEHHGKDLPQEIRLEVVYQDRDVIVLNKQAGLIVHPGAGHQDGTLLNALLYAFDELASLPRAGLIHRLDKDTSGLMVVARNMISHTSLVRQMQQRQVGRTYMALCNGHIRQARSVDAPLARNPRNRLKMAVVASGKPALSHITPLQYFADATLVRVRLHTGRTHQIRVHLRHIGHPLVGDPLYGTRQQKPAFSRQALHAMRLELIHPGSGNPRFWEAQMPQDMQDLIASLGSKGTT